MVDISKLVQGKNLTVTEEGVLRYIIENFDEVLKMGVRGVARNNYTSTSTIMRLTKKLGYTGFVDMHYKLLPLVENVQVGHQADIQFIDSFCNNTLLKYNTYENMKAFAKKIYDEKNQFIFIYGTGLSSIAAEYLYKKLLILGKKCILATGRDSIGVFENNLDSIYLLIVISKSGETQLAFDKAQTAKENGIFTVSFTNETENRINGLSDIKFKVEDINKLDDRNMMPNTFFPDLLMLIELLVYEYHRVLLEHHEAD